MSKTKVKKKYHFGHFSKCYEDENSPRYAVLNAYATGDEKPETLKIASYNIKMGRQVRQAVRLFKNHVDLKNIDVICLQEMTAEGVEYMSQELKMNFVFYPAANHRTKGKDVGNAILSHLPMESDRKINLPISDVQKSRRIAVSVYVTWGERKVLIYSLHQEVLLKAGIRKFQLETLVKTIPGDHEICLIAGDFNTFQKINLENMKAIFEEFGFHHASSNIDWTYKHWYFGNKKSILDHLFSKGLTLIENGRIKDRRASDHALIWAEFRI